MRKIIELVLSAAMFAGVLSAGAGGVAFAAEDCGSVYLGGVPLGITLNADGLIVTGVCDVVTEEGSVRPLGESGIRTGDVVKSVNGERADNLFRFREAVSESEDGVVLTLERDGGVFEVRAVPAKEAASGERRLGLCLKDNIEKIKANPSLKEHFRPDPLILKSGPNTYRATFDCKKCEMTLTGRLKTATKLGELKLKKI